jgi:DNA-binding NtrC family response regulator
MNCEPARIAATPVTKRLEDEVRRLATTPRTTISIVGEAGVGKQAWARRLHAESARSDGPFVMLEPGEILDEGVFASASEGSLYLRETARLSSADQERLLGLLAGTAASAGPRILAGSRAPLEAAVASETLREDLEYRLNVLVLEVPPLRERLGELGALAVHLLGRLTPRLGLEAIGLEPQAEAQLASHDWPGNLHELAWRLEGALLARLQTGATGPLCAVELPFDGESGPDRGHLGARELNLDKLEGQAVRLALELSGGNRSLAARHLGIHRTTLYHKMRHFGLR